MPNTAKKQGSAKRFVAQRRTSAKPATPAKQSPAKKPATPAKQSLAKKPAARRAADKKPATTKSTTPSNETRPPAIDPDWLAEQIDLLRPALRAHGGDIELVRIKKAGRVVVRLTGACAGCPMAQLTLKQGVEKFLVKRVPGVTAVEAVPPAAA